MPLAAVWQCAVHRRLALGVQVGVVYFVYLQLAECRAILDLVMLLPVPQLLVLFRGLFLFRTPLGRIWYKDYAS